MLSITDVRCVAMCCAVVKGILQYSTAQKSAHSTVLYCTALYRAICSFHCDRCSISRQSALSCTSVHHSTVRYSTV